LLHVSNKGKEFYKIDSRSVPKAPDVEAGTETETGTDAGSRKCCPNQKRLIASRIIIEIIIVLYFLVKLFT